MARKLSAKKRERKARLEKYLSPKEGVQPWWQRFAQGLAETLQSFRLWLWRSLFRQPSQKTGSQIIGHVHKNADTDTVPKQTSVVPPPSQPAKEEVSFHTETLLYHVITDPQMRQQLQGRLKGVLTDLLPEALGKLNHDDYLRDPAHRFGPEPRQALYDVMSWSMQEVVENKERQAGTASDRATEDAVARPEEQIRKPSAPKPKESYRMRKVPPPKRPQVQEVPALLEQKPALTLSSPLSDALSSSKDGDVTRMLARYQRLETMMRLWQKASSSLDQHAVRAFDKSYSTELHTLLESIHALQKDGDKKAPANSRKEHLHTREVWRRMDALENTLQWLWAPLQGAAQEASHLDSFLSKPMLAREPVRRMKERLNFLQKCVFTLKERAQKRMIHDSMHALEKAPIIMPSAIWNPKPWDALNVRLQEAQKALTTRKGYLETMLFVESSLAPMLQACPGIEPLPEAIPQDILGDTSKADKVAWAHLRRGMATSPEAVAPQPPLEAPKQHEGWGAALALLATLSLGGAVSHGPDKSSTHRR